MQDESGVVNENINQNQSKTFEDKIKYNNLVNIKCSVILFLLIVINIIFNLYFQKILNISSYYDYDSSSKILLGHSFLLIIIIMYVLLIYQYLKSKAKGCKGILFPCAFGAAFLPLFNIFFVNLLDINSSSGFCEGMALPYMITIMISVIVGAGITLFLMVVGFIVDRINLKKEYRIKEVDFFGRDSNIIICLSILIIFYMIFTIFTTYKEYITYENELESYADIVKDYCELNRPISDDRIEITNYIKLPKIQLSDGNVFTPNDVYVSVDSECDMMILVTYNDITYKYYSYSYNVGRFYPQRIDYCDE